MQYVPLILLHSETKGLQFRKLSGIGLRRAQSETTCNVVKTPYVCMFTPMFFRHFNKVKQLSVFLFASLDKKPFKMRSTIKRENFLQGHIFLQELIPIKKGGKMKLIKLLPLKVYLFTSSKYV